MLPNDENNFVDELGSFLEENLNGDSVICLDFLRERIKFFSKPQLTIDTKDENYKKKMFIAKRSTNLLSKMKFNLQNDLYTYSGSQELLSFMLIQIEKKVEQEKEKIDKMPRMVLLGPKTLNRAFYPFQGSYRYMVGFIESQGSRPTMEDEIVIYGMGPRMRKNEDYFAIFDGHGGPEASAFAAKNLHDIFDTHLCRYPGYSTGSVSEADIIEAFQSSFREIDNSMCGQYGMQAGACALVTYFSNNTLFTANLGDSRAVMGTKQGTVRITTDHKPMATFEYERITTLPGGFVVTASLPARVQDQLSTLPGGFVTTDSLPARVQGQLSVSRALGDRHLKPFVSGDPDITVRHLTCDDYFIILGCDGVWDKITDEEAVDLTLKTNNPQEAAANILKKIKGKSDNISIVVIFLQSPRLWSLVNQQIEK